MCVLQIVDVNLTSEGKVKLEPAMELPFSYQVSLSLSPAMCMCVLSSECVSQVTWRASTIQFSRRFEKYLDPNFFQHRVSSDHLSLSLTSFLSASDPLVLHIQLIHDGHLPGGAGQHDPHEDPPQRLRQIQQR